MKKKILVIALAIAVIAMMVGGSLAYFTAEDEVNNTFTIGSVKIEIYENDEPTPDAENPLGTLVPVVDMTNPSGDESYIDKVVDVKNTGANAAYIRTHIAVPTALVPYLYLDLDVTGWAPLGETTTADPAGYTVYSFDYLSEVAPNDFTTELLKGVYLGSNVDLEADANGDLVFILRDLQTGEKIHDSGFVAHTNNGNGTYTSTTVNILVASQAIQTAGFSDAQSALASGFGVGTNPWQ